MILFRLIYVLLIYFRLDNCFIVRFFRLEELSGMESVCYIPNKSYIRKGKIVRIYG
jgi:hypothetical protein